MEIEKQEICKDHRVWPRINGQTYRKLCRVATKRGINHSEVVHLALEPFLAAELDELPHEAGNPAV